MKKTEWVKLAEAHKDKVLREVLAVEKAAAAVGVQHDPETYRVYISKDGEVWSESVDPIAADYAEVPVLYETKSYDIMEALEADDREGSEEELLEGWRETLDERMDLEDTFRMIVEGLAI